jgi:ketosteroid isomerase-like protein
MQVACGATLEVPGFELRSGLHGSLVIRSCDGGGTVHAAFMREPYRAGGNIPVHRDVTNMRARLSLSLAAVCLLTLPSARAFGQTSAEARKSWDASIQDAKRLFLKCDAEGLASGVTDDYSGINAAGYVTKGRAAELKGQRDFCAANTVTAWDATTTDFHSSGPLAWAAGTMSMTWTVKATGKVEKHEAHYLATLAQQPDGKWAQQYFMTAPMRADKKIAQR